MDQYEVLEKLGAGSFGTIRKIVRKQDRKVLVWKEIRYGRMNEKEKSMLVSEVNILRELKHANIVRYKDRIIDRESATIFIIMEFCENGDLASVIRKYKRSGKKMEEHKIWSILFQLTCALHECHNRKDKILHRDIKPANVFIDKHHNFKLGDFGLAKVLGDNAEFARTNVGTPYYMAPEQVNEVPYNEKCDIWSLGCLIYELAAKAPPFEAHNQLALAVKIKAGKVQRLPEPYSDELNHAVRSMLCLDPNKRPSVEDLLRMPRMQELAEVSMKTAMSVPQPYLDRYFSSQMKRLEQKEAELNQRSTDLAAKEKEKRPGGGGSGVSDTEVAKRESEVSAREREVERKEAELRRREREVDDAKASAEARDKAVSEREKAVADKEKVCAEREKKADKAKQEYSLLFNELKWRKRALDDQHRKLERASSDVTTASSAASDETTATTATTAGTATTVRGSTDGSGADERWAKRNELPSRTASAANKPRPSTSAGEHPQSRSPTPHPRQGFLMDGAAADNKLRRVPSAADPAVIKPRYNGADGFKGRGLVKGGSDVSEEAQETSQPFNVHARRMFAAPPVGDDLDSSIDSPPAPRRLNTAPPAAAVA